jgi:hypothetical protein
MCLHLFTLTLYTYKQIGKLLYRPIKEGRGGSDRMVVGITAIYAISAYHLVSSNPAQGSVFDIILCDTVYQ